MISLFSILIENRLTGRNIGMFFVLWFILHLNFGIKFRSFRWWSEWNALIAKFRLIFHLTNSNKSDQMQRMKWFFQFDEIDEVKSERQRERAQQYTSFDIPFYYKHKHLSWSLTKWSEQENGKQNKNKNLWDKIWWRTTQLSNNFTSFGFHSRRKNEINTF